MKQNIKKLSKNEKKFLLSLLNGGNKTDTEIAKKTGISKATCSRIRKRLEKKLITDYIPIIELDKVGIDIFVVLLFKWDCSHEEDITKKFFSKLESDPHVIFLAYAQNPSEFNTVCFLGFEDIYQHNDYFKEFNKKYGNNISRVSTLVLPSKEVIKTDFTDIIKHIVQGVEKK